MGLAGDPHGSAQACRFRDPVTGQCDRRRVTKGSDIVQTCVYRRETLKSVGSPDRRRSRPPENPQSRCVSTNPPSVGCVVHDRSVACDHEGCDYSVTFQVLGPSAAGRFTSEPLPWHAARKKGGGSTRRRRLLLTRLSPPFCLDPSPWFLTTDHRLIPERSRGRLRASQRVLRGGVTGWSITGAHITGAHITGAHEQSCPQPAGLDQTLRRVEEWRAGSRGRSGTGSTKSVKQSCPRRHT
jgi:hypothetical protein